MSFIINPYRFAGGTGFLADIQAQSLDGNLIFCMDAGASDSYAGSGQTWTDQTGNGNDFWLGTDGSSDTTDPTFNGVAGSETSSEYFSVDGGDWLTIKSNPTIINGLHKANATWTVGMWVYPVHGANDGFWGTEGGSGAANVGAVLYRDSQLNLSIGNGGSRILEAKPSGADTTANAWNLVFVSFDEAGGATASHMRVNGSTWTFNGAMSSESSSDATYSFQTLTRGNGDEPAGSGARIAGAFVWDVALSTTQTGNLWTEMKTRFGL